MRPGYAHTPGGAIHFAEAGSGEAVLLLHANPRSHRYFRHALPLLGQRFRAIAVDTPGFGNSHPMPEGAGMREIAACFIAFMDALGLRRVHLMGLHTGNKIASVLAADWPERIGRTVLCGQTHSLVLDKSRRDETIGHHVEHYFPHYDASPDGAHLVRGWASAWAELTDLAWPQPLKTGARVDAEQIETARARVLDYLQGWRSIVPGYEALFRFDMEAALKRMPGPALVLELLTPGEMYLGEQAPRLCAVMKNATAASVQTDGEVFEARPEAVTGIILDFLGPKE